MMKIRLPICKKEFFATIDESSIILNADLFGMLYKTEEPSQWQSIQRNK